MKEEIIEKDGKKYKVIELIEENKKDSRLIHFEKYHFMNEYECLEAVKQDGDSIQYLTDKQRTEEVCLEAVKKHGDSIQYITNKSMFEKLTGLKVGDKQ